MWKKVLHRALGSAGEVIISFIDSFIEQEVGHAELLAFIEAIVREASKPASGVSSDLGKRAWVKRVVTAFARGRLGLDISDSMLNALIELTVQKVKRER